MWKRIGCIAVLLAALPYVAMAGTNRPGLNLQAKADLANAGLTKYLGEFTPVSSNDVGDGWTRHTYDTQGGDGPICIAGTPYSVYSKTRDPKRVLIMLQGGGACWQDFYACNILAEDQAAPLPDEGIWADSFDTGSQVRQNPLQSYSIVYMPYCDGSVFTGDNDVADANFPNGPVRFHRGLRNVSAGMDLARSQFPEVRRIVVAGSSAGGVGAAAFTPFLARFAFGNRRDLAVFNDAGPVAVNLADVDGIQARAADWRFGQFYPASCADCDDQGQPGELIRWRLANDSTIREAFYSTDGDGTNRFFLGVPTQEAYRELIVTEHGSLNTDYPDRYKRFIRSGDTSHTALQSSLYFLGEANGVSLNRWMRSFLVPTQFWSDIVEDFVPASPGVQ